MDIHEEEERAAFHARLQPAGLVLHAAHAEMAAALLHPDYQEARRIVDRVLDVLANFVKESRPPER